jgi:hypothetical protein
MQQGRKLLLNIQLNSCLESGDRKVLERAPMLIDSIREIHNAAYGEHYPTDYSRALAWCSFVSLDECILLVRALRI